MQTTAIGTVANSLPENEVILLTLLISKGYILFAELHNIYDIYSIYLSLCSDVFIKSDLCVLKIPDTPYSDRVYQGFSG